MHIGLFFGSFNPIHIGHLIIANYIYEYSELDQIWFVVSPQNPLKKKQSLLEDHYRLEMVYLAIGKDPRFRVSDVEFRMPKPSYTCDTLAYLEEQFPMHTFALILGADNLSNFNKWKNSELLSGKYTRYIYPRYEDKTEKGKSEGNIIFIDAPRIEISSSFIRQAIAEGKNVQYFLPPKVYSYIDKMLFYRQKL